MAKVRQPTILILSPATATARLVAERFAVAAAKLGLSWEAILRTPEEATAEERQSVRRIIALVPVEGVEVWDLPASVETVAIEAHVNQLIARLLGGGGEPPPEPEPTPAVEAKPAKRPTVKVGRETKGRKGKGVTTISDLPLDESGLKELAGKLKERCGTGGTVEDGRILIQGDQRERVCAELEKLGYRTVRAGG